MSTTTDYLCRIFSGTEARRANSRVAGSGKIQETTL